MLEIFNYTFFQNALMAVVLVSISAAIVGTYVVVRRMVFITGGITHASFGGLGLGFYAGINPVVCAVIFAVASALGVEFLTTRERLREDSAIGVVWALGMALGTIFIFLTPGYVPELTSFLFGNILSVTTADLIAFAILTVTVIAVFTTGYSTIVLCAFDPDFARTQGIRATWVNTGMTLLVSVCIVLTIRLIGIMLLMSLLTMPQMVAQLFTNRLKPMMVRSAVVSFVCSLIGLWASYLANVPASATIVVTLIITYFIARILTKLFHSRNKQRLLYV